MRSQNFSNDNVTGNDTDVCTLCPDLGRLLTIPTEGQYILAKLQVLGDLNSINDAKRELLCPILLLLLCTTATCTRLSCETACFAIAIEAGQWRLELRRCFTCDFSSSAIT